MRQTFSFFGRTRIRRASDKRVYAVGITKYRILFEEEEVTATIEMLQFSGDLYRIETVVPFMEDIISYGDTIDAATGIDGTLIFRRVAKKSDYTAYSYVVTEKVAQCVELKAILEKVKELV